MRIIWLTKKASLHIPFPIAHMHFYLNPMLIFLRDQVHLKNKTISYHEIMAFKLKK